MTETLKQHLLIIGLICCLQIACLPDLGGLVCKVRSEGQSSCCCAGAEEARPDDSCCRSVEEPDSGDSCECGKGLHPLHLQSMAVEFEFADELGQPAAPAFLLPLALASPGAVGVCQSAVCARSGPPLRLLLQVFLI